MRVEGLGPDEDDTRDRVGERVGRGRGGERAGAERRNLPVEQGAEQRVAAGEAPVHRGAGAAGLARDVVERGLGHTDPGDARESAVEDPVGEDGRIVHLDETVLR